MISRNVFVVIIAIAALTTCSTKKDQSEMSNESPTDPAKTVQSYGTLPDGREVFEYTLRNANGMTMKVINYGGIVTSLTAPDRNGRLEDVVLGFDSLNQYVENNPYFGCLIGRFGNRIAGGKFELEGTTYTLARNNGANHLHGGDRGFDKVFWNIEQDTTADGPVLKLTYLSHDMEEGYPGNLSVEVTYLLTDKNEWKISYRATTDKKTIINLTQHTYFNLSGNTRRDILGHELMLNADQFIPVDETLIPLGDLVPVKGTPFDFTSSKAVSQGINGDHPQVVRGGGYDHCWVLNREAEGLVHAATLRDPTNGRVLEVHTSEPGIQFYSGNFLDGSLQGKFNTVYAHRYGLCLETQHFPDSPNQKNFPSVELAPGETYESTTVFRFSAE